MITPLTKYYTDHGGNVLTNRRARSILIEKGEARGVVVQNTETGFLEEYAAPVVVCAIPIFEAVSRMSLNLNSSPKIGLRLLRDARTWPLRTLPASIFSVRMSSQEKDLVGYMSLMLSMAFPLTWETGAWARSSMLWSRHEISLATPVSLAPGGHPLWSHLSDGEGAGSK